MKHLSQKELVHEGFGSFMGKLGAGIGAAGRELGKQLLKDAPALTGAAKSMGSIIKAATDTDPLIAIKNFLKDDMWAKKHINDDMKARGSLGKPGPAKDSGGKVKNKNIIHVPIIRGKYVNPEGIEEDFAGGHISMMRDADGGWKVDNFFGPNDPNKGVKPASTPTVTSGRPAPGEGPGMETGEATPGAEIKDSKEVVLKVGDRVEFTKRAREMQGKKGAIKSIEGPAGITISVEPGGSEAKGVDPQLVVKIADGEGEPPADPSRPEAEGGDELDSGPETVTSANFKEKLKEYVATEKPGQDLTSKEAIAGFVMKLAKEAGNNNWAKHMPTKLKQVKPDAVEYTNKAVWTNEELNKLVQHLIQQGILKESQKNLLQHLTLLAR